MSAVIRPEMVDVTRVAKLMRMGVLPDGWRGITPHGHPVSVRLGHVVVDARGEKRVQLDG